MHVHRYLNHFAFRNLLGLLALMLAHYIPDYYYMDQRPGLSRYSPYLYLLLLYGWLIFHNRFLFERLFLTGKQSAYFGWLLLLLAFGSFNMHVILQSEFGVTRTLSYMVGFYLYTITGLGVYVTYRYLHAFRLPGPAINLPPAQAVVPDTTPPHFTCMVDGAACTISHPDIVYVESLENYLKIVTRSKTFVTRLTLKEAEARLPKPQFIRVSKSHLVNTVQIDQIKQDAIIIGEKTFRIGRVYKHYVLEQLSVQTAG